MFNEEREYIMSYHEWEDEDFDWDSLYAAIKFYTWMFERFAFMTVFLKEKYGTMRIQHLYLGRIYANWCKVTWYNQTYIELLCKWQRVVFNITTYIAVHRWSHIKHEIMDEPEFDGLLYEWMKKLVGYEYNWE